VPRRAIATTARLLYGENYKCAPTGHRIQNEQGTAKIDFRWKVDRRWCGISVQTLGLAILPNAGTLEQFITEHYWGYSAGRNGSVEYRVSHEPWRVWATASANFEGDASSYYEHDFNAILQRPPDSAFVAEGSAVTVFRGNRIRGNGR
jgi:uncharacterized protein